MLSITYTAATRLNQHTYTYLAYIDNPILQYVAMRHVACDCGNYNKLFRSLCQVEMRKDKTPEIDTKSDEPISP